MKRRFLALALAAGLLTPAPSRAAEHAITLGEAVRLAIQKNEGLVSARESAGAARGTLKSANGAYDPVLYGDGTWQRVKQPTNSSIAGATLAPENESSEGGLELRQYLPTGGTLSLKGRGGRETDQGFVLLSPAYLTRVGAEFRQPLLRNRSIDPARRDIKVAKAGRAAAEASLDRVTIETLAAVEGAYWNLVDARLEVGVRQRAVELAQEQLTETQHRVDTGSVPRTELSQPRAELERRRGELLEATQARSRAQNALKLLILAGSSDAMWDSDLAPVEDAAVSVSPVDIAAEMERALKSRPEVAVAQAIVDQRHAETSFAKNGRWPSLDAVVSYDRFGIAGDPAVPPGEVAPDLQGKWGDSFQSLTDGDFDAARVALELELPIVNRAARGATEAASSRERAAQADLELVRKSIRVEVLDAAAALETAGQRIEAAKAGREAAEVQLSAEQDRYATGLSTNFLVLTRQNDLSRAQLDEISSLTDYRAARTEMARATGRLAEEYGVDSSDTQR